MTAPADGWSWERVDAEIAAGGFDVAGLAAELGVGVEEAEGFVRLRRALLEGRANRAAGGEGLTEAGLRAAEVRAGDIGAYLRVAEVVCGPARATGSRGRGGAAM